MKSTFAELASEELIQKTLASLRNHGIEAEAFDTLDDVRTRILNTIPKGAEVFTISSETLRLSGITDAINGSRTYISVRKQLNESKDPDIKRKLGATPEYAIGSVQALTEDGHLWIVSATGSQLASCVYGAKHVIYVIGAQKIVRDDTEAMQRIFEHSLPLESERTRKIFGTESRIGKLLTIYEDKPGRTKVYIVRQNIGF